MSVKIYLNSDNGLVIEEANGVIYNRTQGDLSAKSENGRIEFSYSASGASFKDYAILDVVNALGVAYGSYAAIISAISDFFVDAALAAAEQLEVDLGAEVQNRTSGDANLQNQINAVASGYLGAIAYNASAPTPSKNGWYDFSTGGVVSWLTGTPTVKIGDRVSVLYTAPSTYTYTYQNINLEGVLRSIEFDEKITSNKLVPNGFTQGFIIESNGAKTPFVNYQYSDYTPVTAGLLYTGLVNDALGTIFRYVCFYRDDHTVVAGGSNSTVSSFIPPVGATLVRVSTFSVVYGRLSENVGLFLGPSAIWEDYYSPKYLPKLRDGSGNRSNSILMKSDIDGLTNIKQITIANSDKIILFADSYSEQIHTLKGKSYLSYLSMFSDWNFENYSQGGNDYAAILSRIKSDNATYHPDFGISKYNGNYAFLMSYTNDRNTGVITVANQLNVYLDNLKKVIIAVKGLGLIPVICTEYHNASTTPSVSDLLQSSLSAIADEYGCIFADIFSKTKYIKPTINYPQFWSTSHPGIRVNTIFWDNLKPYIDSLPRPRQAIKIFRKRASFVIATIADLLYQDNFSRAKAFKEINVSQKALLDTDAKYFDDLTAWTDLSHGSQTVCEYFDLRKGTAIAFSDYGMVEIIAPATAKNINTFNLILSDATVSVYVKDLVNNVWVALINNAGVISLPKFMGYFDVDKVSFLLYKAGGFTLTNCYAEWSGIESKDIFSGVKKISKELNTPELLANTKVDVLTNWTITGTLAPQTPFDSALPVGITKMVELTTSNFLSQHFTFTSDALRKRKLQVKLWVRYLPPVFLSTDVYPTNSWTDEDKYDLGEILIQIKKDENNIVNKKHYIGLSWHEILFEIEVPINETGVDLLLKSNDTKNVQFCFASVKIEA